MKVHLRTYSHTALRRLIPASPLEIVCTEGRMVVKHRGFDRNLVSGATFVARAFEPVDLLLTGFGGQATGCTLEMPSFPPHSEEGPLGQRLARHVFADPTSTWSAATFSALTGISALRIRRKLFAEGVAFTEVCRNQRLMRLLFAVLCEAGSARSLVNRVGWPAASDVEIHFFDRFGMTMDSVRELTSSRKGWQRDLCAGTPPTAWLAAGA